MAKPSERRGHSQWLLDELSDAAALAWCWSTCQTIKWQSIGVKGRNWANCINKLGQWHEFNFAINELQSASLPECIMILDSKTVSLATKKYAKSFYLHALSVRLNTNTGLSDGISAKELKHMPFISDITDKNHHVVLGRWLYSRGTVTRVLHVIRLCPYAGCPAILYIRPFVLSVTSIYLNWSMLQCATVAGARSLLLFPNVNRYVSMRLERSLTKGGIWPDTAQYANYRQPDEVPFHQHLIWENRSA